MKTFDEETLQKIATLAFSIHARAGQCEAEASVTMPGTHAHRSFQDIEADAKELRALIGVDVVAEAMGGE